MNRTRHRRRLNQAGAGEHIELPVDHVVVDATEPARQFAQGAGVMFGAYFADRFEEFACVVVASKLLARVAFHFRDHPFLSVSHMVHCGQDHY